MTEKTTFGPEGTLEFGRALAQELKAGSVVALIGPLGSGKTILIQGICSGLGVVEPVTSPSFVIINEYPGKIRGTFAWVYHFDLYRLEKIEEFIKLGYEEYFYGNGITLIEWAEKIKDFLPEKRIDINLEIVSEKERKISVRRFES
jgi:tRNA threonylcarbamoyladenosine biosynthesis protein TsaE